MAETIQEDDKGKGGVVVSNDHGAGKEAEEREMRSGGREGKTVKYGRAGEKGDRKCGAARAQK